MFYGYDASDLEVKSIHDRAIVEENGIAKTGIYVKDSITGIGTLTYIDPESKVFGALGHEIIESSTVSKFEIKDGKIEDFNSAESLWKAVHDKNKFKFQDVVKKIENRWFDEIEELKDKREFFENL